MKFLLALPLLGGLAACSLGPDAADVLAQMAQDPATACFYHQDTITGTTILVRANSANTTVNGQNCNVSNATAVVGPQGAVITIPAVPAIPATPATK